VKVRLWGTRGSLPAPGPETVRYGGNTACVEVRVTEEHVLILDAGSGIRRLGSTLDARVKRIDILLSHAHLDHILGLGFFTPLFRADLEVHIWGPSSNLLGIRARLSRYLSQPLFPVRVNDLPCNPTLHDVPLGRFPLPGLQVTALLICHPGPTVGYRIEDGGASLAYLPDHEPALSGLPSPPAWLSGYDLARDVDLLIHDAQYTPDEYAQRVGWGHSAVPHTLAFAAAVGAGHLVPFHHDPDHTDADLDALFAEMVAGKEDGFTVTPATEGATFDL
jgi:phosphoribosyl 1,2-cyclic phosphodiesterase